MSPSANSTSTWAGFTSPDTTAKASMSCAVSVRTNSAESPTLISSNGRFSINPRGSGSDDMVSSINVGRVAADRVGKIGHETGGHRADLINGGQAMQRRATADIIDQRVKVINARGCPRFQGAGGQGVDANVLTAKFDRQIAGCRLQGGFDRPHDVVVIHHFF